MMFTIAALPISLALCTGTLAQSYSATYLPSNAPDHSEQGQSGSNQCGTGANQSSQCQNSYINSLDDFCVWGPPEPGPGSAIGNVERIVVAYCMKSGYGTRLIPDGTIKGARFVQTPDYVQITGVGDFTKINIPAGDAGGEEDPHGADGNGNPVGGLVFSSAFGQLQQIHEWTNFMAVDQFCFRACKPGPNAAELCQHIYDVMGCEWNMPANYSEGSFEQCAGDSGEPMGVYGTSTFYQGEPVTPAAHPAPSSSSCTSLSTVSNGFVASGTGTRSGTIARVTSPPFFSQKPSTTIASAGATETGGASSDARVAGSLISLGLLTFGFVNML